MISNRLRAMVPSCETLWADRAWWANFFNVKMAAAGSAWQTGRDRIAGPRGLKDASWKTVSPLPAWVITRRGRSSGRGQLKG